MESKPNSSADTNGSAEYRTLVLEQIARLGEQINALEKANALRSSQTNLRLDGMNDVSLKEYTEIRLISLEKSDSPRGVPDGKASGGHERVQGSAKGSGVKFHKSQRARYAD